jgi:hypothetical protein
MIRNDLVVATHAYTAYTVESDLETIEVSDEAVDFVNAKLIAD